MIEMYLGLHENEDQKPLALQELFTWVFRRVSTPYFHGKIPSTICF